jgi:DNA-binding PadR family transcriptional regulator
VEGFAGGWWTGHHTSRHGWGHRHGPHGRGSRWAEAFDEWFGEPGPRADRGIVRYLVLDAIADQPRHGYEIMQVIEERSGRAYRPSAGVVYPTLQMLEEVGHARCTEKDGRKTFAITDAGRLDLDQHKEDVEDFYGRTGGAADWERSAEAFADLGERVRRLFRLYKRAARSGHLSPSVLRRVRDVLDEALQKIEAALRDGSSV